MDTNTGSPAGAEPTTTEATTASTAQTSASAEAGQATQTAAAAAETVAGGAGADSVAGADTATATEAGTGGADSLAGADPADVVPDTAAGYTLEIGDEAKAILGDMKDDPALGKMRDQAKAEGWTQKQFNERISPALTLMAKSGLLQPAFDPAAELAKLSENGQNGAGRRQDLEVFANALLERKELDAETHAELMTLAPTAAGVRLVETFRKMMGPAGIVAPIEAPGGGGDKAKAAEMRRDPRYESDRKFRTEADRLAQASYGKG